MKVIPVSKKQNFPYFLTHLQTINRLFGAQASLAMDEALCFLLCCQNKSTSKQQVCVVPKTTHPVSTTLVINQSVRISVRAKCGPQDHMRVNISSFVFRVKSNTELSLFWLTLATASRSARPASSISCNKTLS